jgi:WD40 repeat protein
MRSMVALVALTLALPACRRGSGGSPPVKDDAGTAGTVATGPAVVAQTVGPVDAAGDPLPDGAIARLGSLRFLDRGLQSMVVAAGGKELVSSGVKGYVIWDAATGRRLAELRQDDPGAALAASPGGALIATQIAGKGKAQLWDLANRKPLGQVAPGREVDALCFAGDGVLVTGSDGLVVAWTIDGGELRRLAIGSTDLTALACSPGVAMWGDSSGKVFAVELAGDAAPVALGTAGKRITALAASGDGAEIAAGAADGNVHRWSRAAPGKPTVIQAHDRTVASVAWAGDTLWTSGGDAWLRRWDKGGELLKELDGIPGLARQYLALTPDGGTAATWAEHRGAKGSEAGRFWLWDLATGDLAGEPERHGAGLNAIAFAPDGKHVATASEDGTVRVWEVPGGKPAALLTAHEGPVNVVRFSRDGETLYSAGTDAYLYTWQWKSDRDSKLLGPIGGEVNAMALSPDDGRLVTGDEVGRVWSWDVAARAKLQAHDRQTYASITGVALAPDGKRLAITGSERVILVVDLSSGGEVARLEPDVVSSFAAAFSPDGNLLATAGDDGRVRLWDTATWKPVRDLEGHDGSVRAVAFSTDGARLVSGGNDGTARMWKVADGQSVRVMTGHLGAVTSVAIALDGKTVATASQDRTGLLWEVP